MRSDNISGIIIFIFAKAEKSADFPAFLFSQEGAVTGNNKKAIVFAFLHQRWLRIGAADEARTRYLHLGKVALYQMSYGRILETLLGLLTGASDRNRTNDTGIFSPLLYRLSYRGISGAIIPAPSHSYFKRGPRESLRSKILWGRGESLAFITAVLLARPPDEL